MKETITLKPVRNYLSMYNAICIYNSRFGLEVGFLLFFMQVDYSAHFHSDMSLFSLIFIRIRIQLTIFAFFAIKK
jgi:hypothetical protein